MKVILLQDVANLGKAGDLKDVANGYARNYLLPRQLAAGATPALISNREQRVAAEKRKVARQDETNKQLAERVGQVALTFRAKVGSQGRLYGSITSQDIATALREAEGISIDRRTISLADPIRTVGTFNVPVRVASGLERALTVKVIDESTPATAEEQSVAK